MYPEHSETDRLRVLRIPGDLEGPGSASLPEIERPVLAQVISTSVIRDLIKSGEGGEALVLARTNVDLLARSYREEHRYTLYALANLMHFSVRAADSHFVSDREVHLLAQQATSPSLENGHFRMHTLSRLTEFSAYFAAERSFLLPVARDALERLHQYYPLSNASPELRRLSATIALTAASDILNLEKRQDSPDYRALDYIASCGRERLALFSHPESELYYGLYEMRRGSVENAIRRFDKMLQEIEDKTSPLGIAVTEAILKGYLAVGHTQRAREQLAVLLDRSSEFDFASDHTQLGARIKRYQRALHNS